MLVTDWDLNLPSHLHQDAIDVYTPPGPGSNMRSRLIRDTGMFRLSRRTSSLYSVEVKSCGAWGRLLLMDGNGTELFYIPSVFTGSFVLEACCHNGLILFAQSGPGADTLLTINWREPNAEIC